MPYKKSLKQLNLRERCTLAFIALPLAVAVVFALFVPQIAKAQAIEKLELVLGSPFYASDKQAPFEVRGNIYPKGTAFQCLPINAETQPPGRIGTYRITIPYGNPAEFIGTITLRLNDGRYPMWNGYFKIDPNEDSSTDFSWAYEGIILHSAQPVLTDFTPLSRECFGGKLVVYFLNGG